MGLGLGAATVRRKNGGGGLVRKLVRESRVGSGSSGRPGPGGAWLITRAYAEGHPRGRPQVDPPPNRSGV